MSEKPAARWYWATDTGKAKATGPIDERQLRELVTSGKLREGDFVWTTALSEWRRAGDVVGLINATPPLPAGSWPPLPWVPRYQRWFGRLKGRQRRAVILFAICVLYGVSLLIAMIGYLVSKVPGALSGAGDIHYLSQITHKIERQLSTPPKWSYLTKAIPDPDFDTEMRELGKNGWELVTARRALDGAAPKYEVVMKRRIAAD
jgi:hypothetical protein